MDVTDKLEDFIRNSRIKDGFCLIFAPHATAAIILNENEHGLLEDFKNKIKELFPKNENYKHNMIDSNAQAHLASGFINSGRILPIKNNNLVRGIWQNILFLEFDGPRISRKVNIYVFGD